MRTVTIGEFTFGTPPIVDELGCMWVLTGIEGWDDSGSGVRRESEARPQGHGNFSGRGWRTGRSVEFEGHVACPSRAVAAGIKSRLAALLADGSDGELRVVDADEGTLTATVGLADKPVIDWSRERGLSVSCAFELWAPDPLRYREWAGVSTTFPVRTGGLRFPLYSDGAGTDVGALEYGETSSTGRGVLTNPGTADSWPQFEITGPVDGSGFEIVTVGTGARLVFAGSVPAGSRLVIDSATGSAVIDGTADRGGLLTYRDWWPVPAGGSVEFAFIPLGSTSAATLSASVRPAFW